MPLIFLAASVLSACNDPDLSEALSKGRCDSNGRCASGYSCVDQQCVKDTGNTGGAAGTDSCGGSCAEPTPDCCNGQCVSLLDDSNHCKTCGNACLHTACQSGECTNICLPGFNDCDKNALTGCEFEGASCPAPADAGAD